MEQKIHKDVQDYYGKVLKSKKDLKTNACCLPGTVPSSLREPLKKIHPEIQEKFYGCGSPIPPDLEGATVLDLGCGTGRDCYVLSQLVGPQGHVIGVDMTEEQLFVARKHLDSQMKTFGYSRSNIDFLAGYIEDLESLQIKNNSVDVVISNCVLNLSPDKERVFKEIFRVLKPGGELYFSDVFADRRMPSELTTDPVLVGECLGGAFYLEDFRRLLTKLGCPDFRIVEQSPLNLEDPKIQAKVGTINFSSLTIRAFKVELEDRCENYGHVAFYLGTLPDQPHEFILDNHHVFKKGLPVPICGNTTQMLAETRLKNHFRVEGNFSTHYGLFDCGPSLNQTVQGAALSVEKKQEGSCC